MANADHRVDEFTFGMCVVERIARAGLQDQALSGLVRVAERGVRAQHITEAPQRAGFLRIGGDHVHVQPVEPSLEFDRSDPHRSLFGKLVSRLLAGGGTAVLLTTREDALVARLRRQRLKVSSRRIGLLGQAPAIVVASAS